VLQQEVPLEWSLPASGVLRSGVTVAVACLHSARSPASLNSGPKFFLNSESARDAVPAPAPEEGSFQDAPLKISEGWRAFPTRVAVSPTLLTTSLLRNGLPERRPNGYSPLHARYSEQLNGLGNRLTTSKSFQSAPNLRIDPASQELCQHFGASFAAATCVAPFAKAPPTSPVPGLFLQVLRPKVQRWEVLLRWSDQLTQGQIGSPR